MTPQIVTDAPWLKPETIEAKAQSRLSAYEAESGAITKPPIGVGDAGAGRRRGEYGDAVDGGG